MREFLTQSRLDILLIVVLERSIAGLLKMDENSYNFTGMHFACMMPSFAPIADQALLPRLAVSLPKIIDITNKIEYAHVVTSLRIGCI